MNDLGVEIRMKPLHLDTRHRAALAQRILTTLESEAPGSTAQLRGSLAEGRADPYSDIDVFWQVPDDLFQALVDRLREVLANVQPVESLRSAPEFQRSDKRRLIFVQFEGAPLFWRVDLDILAQSIRGDLEYDRHNEAARGDDWSLTHSALMNGVAAVKALLRHREEEAAQLLIRGFERIGLPVPEASSQEQIVTLAESIATMDSMQAGLARRIVELHREAFGQA
jgi:predicted nucleotidyltransferase